MISSKKIAALCISCLLLLPITGCSQNTQAEVDQVVEEVDETKDEQAVERSEAPSGKERIAKEESPGEFDGERNMDSVRQDIEQKAADGELTSEEAEELLAQLEEGGGPERSSLKNPELTINEQ